MARKLAITIAGAVSLGSYESGVAFEILDAVAQHNKAVAEDQKIYIDVLTGASAGGMTVAMIAQRLLYDGNAMNDPYNNPLYNAWVKDVDIVGLLNRGPKEPVSESIFSSDLIAAISKKYLVDRYAVSPPASPIPHPAVNTSEPLYLGLALSNLNGVDYIRPTKSGGRFVYTRHQDQLIESLQGSASDIGSLWEIIRAAAVSCGAFPVAFRTQDLLRNMTDFLSPYLDQSLWGGQPSRFFTYTDGGVFQNEPLGMAKNLVERTTNGRLEAENRGYLFIAPKPKTSGEIPYTTDPTAKVGQAFGAANANFANLGLRLSESVIGESQFQDWIAAEGINDKLALLDTTAANLAKLFRNGDLNPAATDAVSLPLLGLLLSPAALPAAQAQLKQQYANEYAAFGNIPMANAWLNALLVFELSAGLHEKEEMNIYDFLADTKMLAGNQLSAFQGFFDVKYRKHDYDYGRSVAQMQLQQYQNQPGSIFSGLQWKPRSIDPIDPTLNSLPMSKVDKGLRQKVYSQFCGTVDQLLQELNVNPFIRWAANTFYIQGQIKKLLAL
jgi:hypothetical protein